MKEHALKCKEYFIISNKVETKMLLISKDCNSQKTHNKTESYNPKQILVDKILMKSTFFYYFTRRKKGIMARQKCCSLNGWTDNLKTIYCPSLHKLNLQAYFVLIPHIFWYCKLKAHLDYIVTVAFMEVLIIFIYLTEKIKPGHN